MRNKKSEMSYICVQLTPVKIFLTSDFLFLSLWKSLLTKRCCCVIIETETGARIVGGTTMRERLPQKWDLLRFRRLKLDLQSQTREPNL